ncbi:MAG: ribonuclease P protein component 1 [Thermoplasmatota archaeon]
MRRTVPKLEGAARAVARGELIGRQVRVAAALDGGLVGREGLVVDESMRTLRVRLSDGTSVTLPKVGCTFEVATAGGPVTVIGAAIEFRPEDRTKKVR